MHSSDPQSGSATRRDRVARAFYGMLTAEGFTPEQVVGLATHLLDLVHAELESEQEPPPAK